MLTYSLSFNKLNSIPPLKKIVSAKIVEFLWNATPFMPQVPRRVSTCEHCALCSVRIPWEDALAKHREQTISASNTFTEENNLPSVFKTVFKENVYLLCRAYWQVLRWKTMYDPHDVIYDLKSIFLDAPNYFTVDGEFDELAWTKRVLLEPMYPIKSRFVLACYYCLENESAVLWSELKNNDLEYLNVNLRNIQDKMDAIVTIRIFQLENEFEALAQIPQFAGGVYEEGFREAGRVGNEYAIRYFWNKMTEPEKIIEDEYFFDLICYGLEKIGVFVYSHLSEKQKQKYLDWSIETGSNGWGVLLLSPYTEAERSEIIELVYKLPIDQYSSVLADIAEGREKHCFPFHREEVFKVLWTHLSAEERGQVLENCPSIIVKLINSSKFDILDYIMEGLSMEQKEKYFSANSLVAAEMLKSGTG